MKAIAPRWPAAKVSACSACSGQSSRPVGSAIIAPQRTSPPTPESASEPTAPTRFIR